MGLFYEFLYSVDPFSGQWYGDSQPFVYAQGDDTGYGLHGDFFNGWDQAILQNGIDKFVATDAGDAGNVYYDNIFQPPKLSGDMCTLPPMVNEAVTGHLSQLPGCNPVTDTPSPVADCTATKTLGVFTSSIFADMTSKGWEYLGCGSDPNTGPTRALPTRIAATNTMTVDSCVEQCGAAGYSISGLEYGQECWCGHSVPPVAQPTPGLVGSCDMPCAGNPDQMCGDGSMLSLYQKCTTGSCANVQFGLIADSDGGSQADSSAPPPVANLAGSGSQVSSSTTAAATGPTQAIANAVAPLAAGPTQAAAEIVASPISTPTAVSAQAAENLASPSEGQSSTSTTAAADSSSTDSSSTDDSCPQSTDDEGSSAAPSLPSGWSSAGCYTDSLGTRALQGINLAWYGQPITFSNCATYCDGQGMSISGTENGGQCYCGNTLLGGSQKVADSECDSPCDADASQPCGGQLRLSLASKAPPKRRRRHLNAHIRAVQKL